MSDALKMETVFQYTVSIMNKKGTCNESRSQKNLPFSCRNRASALYQRRHDIPDLQPLPERKSPFLCVGGLEIAVFACVLPFAREAALRVGIKSAFLLFLLSVVYAVATAVGGVLLIELLLPVLN